MIIGNRLVIRHWSKTFIVTLDPRRPLTEEERSETEHALFVLTAEYEARDPQVMPIIEGLHAALFGGRFRFASRFGRDSTSHTQKSAQIERDLEQAARMGKLLIVPEARPVIRLARTEAPVAPGLGPAPEAPPTFFEVRFVDEVGEPISGLDVVITAEGKANNLKTDGDGKTRLDGVGASFASARVASVQALRDTLKPRWNQVREGELIEPSSDAPDTTVFFLRGESVESFRLESEKLRTVSVQPYVLLARLIGMFFDTNKNFLLPTALPSIKQVRSLYEQHPKSVLLVVGHTDTSGEPSINDPLSVERAESVAAYLTDDVPAWLDRYGSGVSPSKRWGAHEDRLMIGAVAGSAALAAPNPVRAFQAFHNQQSADRRPKSFEALAEDGITGPLTRGQLVADYMNADGTTLPDGVELVTHGCGENFPLDDTGEELDQDPENPERDQTDRRVELFFFDGKLGVEPPPPGKNSGPGSKQYPEWRRRSRQVRDFSLTLDTVRLRILDITQTPLARADYELRAGGVVRRGQTDDDGILVEPLVPLPNRCTLRWNLPASEDEIEEEPREAFDFSREMFLDYRKDDATNRDEAARKRLHNLGYVGGELQDAVAAFQRDFELDQNPWFDAPTDQKLREVHDEV